MIADRSQFDRCKVVGDFVEEGAVPAMAEIARQSRPAQGHVDRPRVVLEYVDVGSAVNGLREFTVLLRDNREVVVHGHAIEQVPGTADTDDPASYRVVLRSGERNILVATFRASEVTGIFDGAIKTPLTSA